MNTSDILEILQIDIGEIGIATPYLPLRRAYIPFPDFHRLVSKHRPTYIIGNLNATLRNQGNNNPNRVGKDLERVINKDSLIHLGPEFTT